LKFVDHGLRPLAASIQFQLEYGSTAGHRTARQAVATCIGCAVQIPFEQSQTRSRIIAVAAALEGMDAQQRVLSRVRDSSTNRKNCFASGVTSGQAGNSPVPLVFPGKTSIRVKEKFFVALVVCGVRWLTRLGASTLPRSRPLLFSGVLQRHKNFKDTSHVAVDTMRLIVAVGDSVCGFACAVPSCPPRCRRQLLPGYRGIFAEVCFRKFAVK